MENRRDEEKNYNSHSEKRLKLTYIFRRRMQPRKTFPASPTIFFIQLTLIFYFVCGRKKGKYVNGVR